MTTVATTPVPNVVDQKTARKITLAGCVGIFAELYDNGIFGFMAGTLATVFFPDSANAVMLVFVGYAISFFFRPLGGIICGHLGDRIGRQRMLVFVIMLISVATAAIGILPTYAAIGIAAPIMLILLRVFQGFSVGGEAAGAMTFLAEHAPEGKRGLYTSYAQVASFLSLLTGTLIAAGLTSGLGADRMESWGWRIPFLLAVPLGLTGIYIRRRIQDTPNFIRLQEEGGLSTNPLKEAFSSPQHRRAMLLALFIPLMNGSGYYVLFAYMPTFMSKELEFGKVEGLLVTAASLVVISIAIPFMGSLSDKVGRKTVLGHRRLGRDRVGGRRTPGEAGPRGPRGGTRRRAARRPGSPHRLRATRRGRHRHRRADRPGAGYRRGRPRQQRGRVPHGEHPDRRRVRDRRAGRGQPPGGASPGAPGHAGHGRARPRPHRHISSIAAVYNFGGNTIYHATKAAVHTLSRQLRVDGYGRRVRVTEICPGRVETEIFGRLLGDMAKAQREFYDGYESLKPEDIADAIDFAINSPRRVNIGHIEILPTFQVPGGLNFERRVD